MRYVNNFFLTFVLMGLAGLSMTAFAEFVDRKKPPKSRSPKKIIRVAQDQPVYPSIEVANPPEDFTMTVTGDIEGVKMFEKDVPVYYFRPYRVSAGTVPINSEFKADLVRSIMGTHYYGYVKAPEGNNPREFLAQTIWIDGRFLKATRLSKK